MPTLIEISRAYILRGEAYSALQDHFTEGGFKGYKDGQKCMDRIKAIPAADVVERKVGKWEYTQWLEGFTEIWTYECSECKYRLADGLVYERPNFCPHCGAKMDGGPDA